MPAGRPKGIPKTGGGSRKGIPNKTTALVKDMVSQALERAGGVAYLHRQAEASPAAFMTLVGKLIPVQVGGDPDGVPLQIVSDLDRAKAVAALVAKVKGE